MIKIGITPNTIEQVVEHGTIVQSYAVPAVIYFCDRGQQRLFYSRKITKPCGSISNTTIRHVNKYRKAFDAVVQCCVPHDDLCQLAEFMRNTHLHPNKAETKAQQLFTLYKEN